MGRTVPPETNLHVGKKMGRAGSHCATMDEIACREEVLQGWVPLYH